jgi:hypothetical protein
VERLMRVLTLLGLALVLLACENAPAPAPEPAKAPAPAPEPQAAPPSAKTTAYGAPLSGAGQAAALSSVLAAPESYAGKTVTVEGEVRRACTKRGCWMELAENMSADARGARVTFKDYGFFVPTDSAGAHAKLEGVVNVKTLKPAQVEHLESEGAKVAKNEDGSASEVQFVANGVELTK